MLRTKTHNKETSSVGSETKISVRIRHHRTEELKNITTTSRAAAFLVVIARCFVIIQFGFIPSRFAHPNAPSLYEMRLGLEKTFKNSCKKTRR